MLPDSVLALLRTINLELLFTAVAKLEEEGKVVEYKPQIERLVFSLMKTKDTFFATSTYRFLEGDCIDITVPGARARYL